MNSKNCKTTKSDGEFDEYWLFTYEALGAENLSKDWKAMKKAKVSFLLDPYR